jgi:hypothetical protein
LFNIFQGVSFYVKNGGKEVITQEAVKFPNAIRAEIAIIVDYYNSKRYHEALYQ